MREFVIGGLAAMSASSVTHPIDLIKVRMLLHGEGQRGQTLNLRVVSQIYRKEGFRGFYSGALFSTTRFGFYDLVKRGLGETNEKRLPYHRKVIATMTGGALAAFVACPGDVMLVRMQADGRLPVEQRRNYRNVFHALVCTARDEGASQLYRGLSPLVVRGILVTTAQFSTYDHVKELLIHRFEMPDSLKTHFLSSLAAGMVAAIVSTPVDVIKSRMMNSTKKGQHGAEGIVYRNSAHCFIQTARTEGLRGLYKGGLMVYARMAPQVMLMWIFVEQYRKLWYDFVRVHLHDSIDRHHDRINYFGERN